MAKIFYTESHEWIKVEDDYGYVGITDYAQESLGEIVFVELPEVDDLVEAGNEFSAVESVKAATDIISPVSGTIVEVNEELEDNPELINEDAFENWIVKIDLDDKSELDTLLTEEEYKELINK